MRSVKVFIFQSLTFAVDIFFKMSGVNLALTIP